ncbi:MAG: DUF2934 domain-containing protein [Burkholderiales bacterium]|nr:DUF2934 domain-containing protein [Burkholderiales bacterium]
MDQEQRPLYGVLVTASSYEKQSEIPETEAMEGHIRSMIEEAAYYLAEKRGFASGHELEDWLKAKAQILKQ